MCERYFMFASRNMKFSSLIILKFGNSFPINEK